ncbi:MAG: hypothetical protein HOP07_11800 [Bacteriovoracaceae bacterium]|nr:hypothetical protein [Bacteriovoracaceae bacterium]
MKKLILSIGLTFGVLLSEARASDIVYMQMQDIITTDMEYVFEVKTSKFDKVMVDCQSLIKGINFSNNGNLENDIYLEEDFCVGMIDFFLESKQQDLPVCLGLDQKRNELTITRDTDCN